MTLESFESFEEMLDAITERTRRANERLAPEQAAITWDSYWVRFYDPNDRICVFGQVMPIEEFRRSEMEAGSTEQELATIVPELVRRHEDGMMYGRCYSTIEPTGEYGDTHRSNIWPIPYELYEMAEDAGWDIDQMQPAGQDLLEEAYQGWRAHLLALVEKEARNERNPDT